MADILRRKNIRAFIALLSFLTLFSLAAAQNPNGTDADIAAGLHAWENSVLQVAVISEQSVYSKVDEVTIKLVGYQDEELLQMIAERLEAQFKRKITDFEITKGSDVYDDDLSYSMSFYLKIVPYGKEYLPVSEFINAVAPYAKRIRIVYSIQGKFPYRGYTSSFSNKDVEFKVFIPDSLNRDLASIYDFDIYIKNPNVTDVDIPRYEKESNIWKIMRLIIAGGALVIIVALGIIISVILGHKREKEKEAEKSKNIVEDSSNKE